MRITEPKTAEDFEKYYQLRWEMLRKPWNKPEGSEKDELEESSIHAMALNEHNEVVGVVRLQKLNEDEGQLRYMAVKNNVQNKGVGSLLLKYIENKARETGLKSLILQSREAAVNFYLKNNYAKVEKSYLMWGEIQHYLMKKNII
jgi:N-acetylglutamate synthase-like GNAT family acetyltransferase